MMNNHLIVLIACLFVATSKLYHRFFIGGCQQQACVRVIIDLKIEL
jgi:hypothetical protein